MAAFVSGYSQGNGTQNFFNFNPAGSVAGDLLFVLCAGEAGKNLVMPAGWTVYQNVVVGTIRVVMLTRTATGTEVFTPWLLDTFGSNVWFGSYSNYRPAGGEAVDDMDFLAAPGSITAVTPSLTPSGAGGLLACYFVAVGNGLGGGAATLPTPLGMTIRNAIAGSVSPPVPFVTSADQVVVGATETRTSTATGIAGGHALGWDFLIATPVVAPTGEGWCCGAVLLPGSA